MKLNKLNSPRLLELKRQRQKIFLKKALLSLLPLLILFAGLAYVSRISALNMQGIEVVGNTVADTEAIKTSVQEKMAGNYLWFFPKTNIFLYPKNNIKKGLGDEFKRLENIDISMEDGKILTINVSEREGKYMWCGETVELGDSEAKCHFLDEHGFIFDEAPYFSGEVYFKFYGQRDTDFVKFFPLKKILEDMGVEPVGLSVEKSGDVKMFLSRKNSAVKPEIIFKAGADFQKLSENLQAALTTEPLQSEFKNKYSSLEYIDLRYGNKVYYKFK